MIIIPLSSLTYSKIEIFQCIQSVNCYENNTNFNRILIIFTALISAVNQTSSENKKRRRFLFVFLLTAPHRLKAEAVSAVNLVLIKPVAG